ncbi:MAG TPA: M56 family metallopeptidase [Flavobacterium sp.]|uniref:M56 family metallopeptidase n=1 Tax=Flavobacterium sp. TaxID=239 RepID=UPI002B4AC8E0|nr:M56 family metallopeptidase [Flavobacterium sp.]HLO74102.1 M56 family metallopeptidase [Flavobacterium sp.]
MIDFLIKYTICLTVFLSFYHLVLEREKMHRFNRFYLLGSIVISLVIPFITFEIIEIIPAVQNTESLIIDTFSSSNKIVIQEKKDYIPIILWSLYSLISSILIIRFVRNIWKLISKAISKPKVKYKNVYLVLIDEKNIPYTFLNFIYINFEDYNNQNIEDELYTHELVHVNQKHTLDILFIEFLKVIFWFNPLFIFYKKAIQLNHEFLADEEIVKTYNNVPFYQNLLLQKGIGTQTIYLASNLNYLVTKKRLIMMTKSTSRKIAVLKKIAIVPILIGLVYFFCIEIVAQEKNTNQIIKPISTDKIEKISDKDKIRDRYYSGVYVNLIDEKNNRKEVTMYENLSLEDRRKYLDFVPEIMIEKEIPEPLFEKMKTKNMAVWINGKVKTKEEIKKYKRTDFSYYTYSFVHENARSKRFPHEYQYSLYTKKYFDENLKNSHTHFSGDTIKISLVSYKTAMKNVIAKNIKADTLVWFTQRKDGYNLYINDSAKKKKKTKKPEPSYCPDVEPKKNEKVNEIITSDIKNLTEVTEKPTYIGGMQAFYKYVAKNFIVPTEAKIDGNIIVSFVVEKDGSLNEINVLKDIGYGTGEEAIRVLTGSPKWNPGTKEGKPVRVLYTLPISIKVK